MAEQDFVTLSRNAAPVVLKIEQPGLSIQLERDIGIAKLQIFGATAEARFPDVAGFAPPPACGQCEFGPLAAAWLAPGEWLVTGLEPEIESWVDGIDKQGDEDVFAVDLSHARTSFLFAGPNSRTALAAHCPLDLWPDRFRSGAVARSLLGDTGMFIVRLPDGAEGFRFRIIVDQTMAAYVCRLFSNGSFQ